MPTQDPLYRQPRVVAHLSPEDQAGLRELRTILENEHRRPLTLSESIRIALREALQRHRVAA